ncbi:hypothetical protein VNO80_16108 [Phaseolus coccineus]|uniref:Uncharacterized protein n=1 Tax=Phaseolus coccineus TaxID=3886 RepID=A0AAN9MQ75_PHACN
MVLWGLNSLAIKGNGSVDLGVQPYCSIDSMGTASASVHGKVFNFDICPPKEDLVRACHPVIRLRPPAPDPKKMELLFKAMDEERIRRS